MMARDNGDAGAEQCYGAAPGTHPYPFCYIVVSVFRTIIAGTRI